MMTLLSPKDASLQILKFSRPLIPSFLFESIGFCTALFCCDFCLTFERWSPKSMLVKMTLVYIARFFLVPIKDLGTLCLIIAVRMLTNICTRNINCFQFFDHFSKKGSTFCQEG